MPGELFCVGRPSSDDDAIEPHNEFYMPQNDILTTDVFISSCDIYDVVILGIRWFLKVCDTMERQKFRLCWPFVFD